MKLALTLLAKNEADVVGAERLPPLQRADRFEEVVTGIERCLAVPEELAQERYRVVGAIAGAIEA